MISLLTFLLLSTLIHATDDNWTLTLHATRNGSITVISTVINGSFDKSSILIPLIVNGGYVRGKSSPHNDSYHLNLIRGSFYGIYPKCARIRDERGQIHSVCASDSIGMCTRKAKIEDLRVNSISIVDWNESLNLSWNCPSGEECCDFGCCPSDSFPWQLALIATVPLLVLLILAISIYFCCCRKGRENETHRQPAPTISTRQRVSSIRIRVITDPSQSLSSSSSIRHLPSNQPALRLPSAPPISHSDPSPSNIPPYPISILPSAPLPTSSERSLP
ncbi:hypothetical protein PENTCL1PPCAC_17698 [Pristionchus entomophagus]|uniref:CX domain-containing protein n=1 Tax=Pristionchus entomophagus TaxID=358040 RepID=A0AAV5TMR4_9BILA|nr:hypothetical protein PENTCL1PPCAC_17698 [Pristionchus entomophagus]